MGVLFSIVGFLLLFAVPASPADPGIPDIYDRTLLEVKFQDGLPVRLGDGEPRGPASLETASARRALALVRASGGTWQRSYNDLPEAFLDRLRQSGRHPQGRAMPDMNLYFRVRLPSSSDSAPVKEALESLPDVELVRFMKRPPPPPLPPDYSDYSQPTNQAYLDPAPNGLDARYAWTNSLANGAGINVCDIEFTFNTNHLDLAPVTLVGIVPNDPGYGPYHGTQVLGMMASLDNGWGTRGINPDSTFYFSGTWSTDSVWDVAGAIMAALTVCSTGDVILIEQQTYGPSSILSPVEWDKPVYDAIVTAIGQGVTVVEAAGNGGQNLDDPMYSTGNGGHYPFLTTNDSGALIIGSGKSPYSSPARSRISSSNYGATLDLQGWGERVVTLGAAGLYSAEGPNLLYTWFFNGTSSAAPMAAGAAALLQEVYYKVNGTYLTPAQVRQILRDTGTPQQGSENIGPLPDIRAALEYVMGPDADGDALPNLWETGYGLDPFNAVDAGQNPDSDSLDNLGEYLADTHPGSSNEHFRMAMLNTLARNGNEAELDVGPVTSTGRLYTIYYSTGLVHETWTAYTQTSPGTGSNLLFMVTNSADEGFFHSSVRPL